VAAAAALLVGVVAVAAVMAVVVTARVVVPGSPAPAPTASARGGADQAVMLRVVHTDREVRVVDAADITIAVALVVDYGTGHGAPTGVVTKCMNVAPGTTGSTLLASAAQSLHLPAPRFNDSGLLCGINGFPATGCGAPAGNKYRYWSYWHGVSGSWVYASDGPSEQVLTAGAVEGWRFQDPGTASPSDPAPRSPAAYSSICPVVRTPAGATTTTAPAPAASTPATTTPTTPAGSGTASGSAPTGVPPAGGSGGSGPVAGSPSSTPGPPGRSGTTAGAPRTAPAQRRGTTTAGSGTVPARSDGRRESVPHRPLGGRSDQVAAAPASARVGSERGSGDGPPWTLVLGLVLVAALAAGAVYRWRKHPTGS
jgi:hypothetical protein